MRKILIYVSAFTALLACASGCGPNGPNSEEGFQPPPIMPLTTAEELQSVKSVDVLGHSITWLTHDAPGDWGDPKDIEKIVQAVISSDSSRLAALDYVSLSLPAFVTQTQALTLKPSDFTGRGAYEDARGQDDNGEKWLLYAWKGPELPKHPNRPLVFRWVYVYALYNVEDKTVDRLIATIGGEVHE